MLGPRALEAAYWFAVGGTAGLFLAVFVIIIGIFTGLDKDLGMTRSRMAAASSTSETLARGYRGGWTESSLV